MDILNSANQIDGQKDGHKLMALKLKLKKKYFDFVSLSGWIRKIFKSVYICRNSDFG